METWADLTRRSTLQQSLTAASRQRLQRWYNRTVFLQPLAPVGLRKTLANDLIGWPILRHAPIMHDDNTLETCGVHVGGCQNYGPFLGP